MPKTTPKAAPPEDASPATDARAYLVKAGAGCILHDGVAYHEGEPIELSAAYAAALADLLDPAEE